MDNIICKFKDYYKMAAFIVDKINYTIWFLIVIFFKLGTLHPQINRSNFSVGID
jgi:hypothetical protein